MTVKIVIGAQWGDEGKGKIVDLLSEESDIIVRYAGGANAGHTLVVDGKKVVTHMLPSGVLHKGKTLVLGAAMVIDPIQLVDEIEQCEKLGLLDNCEVLISDKAHIVTEYHILTDALRESVKEKSGTSIGTTKKGIGPCYEDKVARVGIQAADFLNEDLLVKKLQESAVRYITSFEAVSEPVFLLNEDGIIQDFLEAVDKLRPYVTDTVSYLHNRLNDSILLEGAQGAMLDIDHGTYPYVTSSSVGVGGALTGAGIGPMHVGKVIGVTKAYCTRVGEGPFPTEMSAEEDEHWRQAGGEFGATTGRPRRCGWLDLAALSRVCLVNGVTELAITKLDVMSGMGELKLCTDYDREGNPVYITLDGWDKDITDAKSIGDLPVNAQNFIEVIAAHVPAEISLVSVGPERHQTIVLP